MRIQTVTVPRQKDIVPKDELVSALNALGQAELAKLNTLAKVRARYCPGLDWRDLLHDAIDRALDGSRSWPRDLPFLLFMRETVRSLASEYRRKYVDGIVQTEADFPEFDYGQSPLMSAISEAPGAERDIAARQSIASILSLFEHDDEVLSIIDAMARGDTPTQAQLAGQLSATQYASAQKRIRRGLARAYPEGMPL